MSNPQWREIERVLLRALELDEDEVEACVDEACGDDEELRAEVLRLLESHRRCLPSFLEPSSDPIDPARHLPGDETLLQDGDSLGKYRILRKIGQGGMAAVYLAVHTRLQNRVALKILPRFATSSEERVNRFKREAITLAKLHHKGIVPVHDVGEAKGLHFLVMDYVEGPTLAQALKATRAHDEKEGGKLIRTRKYIRQQAEWIAMIAEALDHAHQNGIVHRDVKPSNVMLREGREPLLADFGVAKNLLEPSETATGQLAGTAPYMSPEQARAARNTIDPRSDVFSLGTVMYEVLTLRQPFRGDTLEESLKNVLFKSPQRLEQLNPGIPRDLVTICHKALEKDRQHRYSTAAHMAGDLRSFLAGRPILASPPSVWRRCRELVRRRRAALLGALVVLLALCLALLANSSQRWRDSTRARLSLDASIEATQVLSQRLSPEIRRFSPREAIGETPLRESLAPGHYRFTLIGEGGSFRELSVLLEAGTEVDLLVDLAPRDELRSDMVLIDGGLSRGGERVASFHIDRREVSNEEYRRFVLATGWPEPVPWQRYGYPEEQADHPVVAVSWEDCQAYARFMGKRLATSLEWEFAMTRPDGRRLPWKDEELVPFMPPDPEAVSEVISAEMDSSYAQYLAGTGPTHVDEHPSPLGLLHAAGNVREYTDTTEDLTIVLVRGASWLQDPRAIDSYTESARPIRVRSIEGEVQPAWSVQVGFRCARSARPMD